MEARITDALKLDDDELWKILKGEMPLSDNIANNISKQNEKQPSAPNLGGNSYKSAVGGSDLTRPMKFSTYMKLRDAPVEHVESPVLYRGRSLRTCRLPNVGPGQHGGVADVVNGEGGPIFAEGSSVGRDSESSGSARRARSRPRGSTSPPAAKETRVSASQRQENEAAAALAQMERSVLMATVSNKRAADAQEKSLQEREQKLARHEEYQRNHVEREKRGSLRRVAADTSCGGAEGGRAGAKDTHL